MKFLILVLLFAVGCSSSSFKTRQEQREKLAISSGFSREFVNGDVFPDLDVELSLTMAKKCDPNKSMTMTQYRNASDQNGIVYCCNLLKKSSGSAPKKPVETPEEAP